MKAEKKGLDSRTVQRILIISTLALSFMFSLHIEIISTALTIFIWVIVTFLFVNFWLYERRESGTWFVVPLFIMALLMILCILTLIGWLVGAPVFKGFWAELFSWPSLIAIFVLVFYCVGLLDPWMRKDVHHFFRLSKKAEEESL